MSRTTGRVTHPGSTVSVSRAILTHARHPEQQPCAVRAGFLWVPASSPRLRSLPLSSPVCDSALCSAVCPGAPVSSVSAFPARCTARPACSPASSEVAWRHTCCRWCCNPRLEVGWLECRSAVLALQPFTKVGSNLGPFFLPICRFTPSL